MEEVRSHYVFYAASNHSVVIFYLFLGPCPPVNPAYGVVNAYSSTDAGYVQVMYNGLRASKGVSE